MIHVETVVLTHDVAEYGLKQGDMGAVVHRYRNGDTFEVEFVTAAGKNVALLTLTSADIRPVIPSEILHARDLAA